MKQRAAKLSAVNFERGPRRALTAGRDQGLPEAMSVVLVICAPSGAGKTTLVKRLLAEEPRLTFAVSATTRPPRPSEVDGLDYNFVSEERFEGMIERGDFLEWAGVFEHRYGTPRSAVTYARRLGRDILLDIDVQGAASLRDRLPEAVAVFVLPPSREVLERRLRNRATEGKRSLRVRLGEAAGEIAQCNAFDHIVINQDLEEAVAALRSILAAERSKLDRMQPRILPILKGFGIEPNAAPEEAE